MLLLLAWLSCTCDSTVVGHCLLTHYYDRVGTQVQHRYGTTHLKATCVSLDPPSLLGSFWSTSRGSGEQCVLTTSPRLRQTLCAGSWATLVPMDTSQQGKLVWRFVLTLLQGSHYH